MKTYSTARRIGAFMHEVADSASLDRKRLICCTLESTKDLRQCERSVDTMVSGSNCLDSCTCLLLKPGTSYEGPLVQYGPSNDGVSGLAKH